MSRVSLVILLGLASILLLMGGVVQAQDTSAVKGVIKSVNLEKRIVEITVGEGKTEDVRPYGVAKNATVTIRNDNQKALEDVEPGASAILTVLHDETIKAITITSSIKWYYLVGMLAAAIAISFAAGNALAGAWRMNDHGWRMGIMFSSILCSIIIVAAGWPPKYGVDLRGGVTLIYQIATPEDAGASNVDSQRPKAEDIVPLLADRVDPTGTKEIVLRPFGQYQIEIIVPNVGPAEIENIKKRLTAAGLLQFRIVANRQDHETVIEMARNEEFVGKTYVVRRRKVDGDTEERAVGEWVGVRKESDDQRREAGRGLADFKVGVSDAVIRDRRTGEELDVSQAERVRGGPRDELLFGPKQRTFAEYLKYEYVHPDGRIGGVNQIDVLMFIDDKIDLEGGDLASIRGSFDSRGRPSISFNPTTEGSIKMGKLTARNLPDKQSGHERRLGIVLDKYLISAPSIRGTITSRGEITGSFTNDEVKELVDILRAGKLPATLDPNPLSEDRIDSHIGVEMREKGIYAIGASLIMVIVFMILYYRFCGVVACMALATNLVCIVGIIILIKAPFSLTGLAGLVLTVGMSVDANVLIFERIREELDRGATLRMAIRNGFGRASTTIFDANLTTLITAIVLYAIGTDQIKGFAVVLILGILISMYTAIFCSRIVFDVAERRRWITGLTMTRIIGESKFDFIGKRQVAMAGSILLIAIGVVAVGARGTGMLAIDLSGGSSIRVVFDKPLKPDEVRGKLEQTIDNWGENGEALRLENKAKVSFTVTPISSSDLEENQLFKIDFSIPAVTTKVGEEASTADEAVRAVDVVTKAFADGDNGTLLAMNSLKATELELVNGPGGEGEVEGGEVEGGAADAGENTQPEASDGASIAPPADSLVGLEDGTTFVALQTETDDDQKNDDQKNEEKSQDKTSKDETKDTGDDGEKDGEKPSDASPKDVGDPTTETEQPKNGSGELETPDKVATPDRTRVGSKLTFGYRIEEDALAEKIVETAAALKIDISKDKIQLTNLDTPNSDVPGFLEWDMTVETSKENAQAVLKSLEADVNAQPYFRGESGVGGQIADTSKWQAIGALLASLLGIVGYIWIRFQRVVFGLAAVVALVHDVLFVLGAIAVSYYLAGSLGFLGINEFKISLPIVAAFLTIIGYSLNDTIVVFDRIREVRGKSPDLTGEMINKSIGQTLSRTILTSLTTLLVVVILFVWGGDAIHGFAFALLVGVLVGTYSSIFVASPVLLWLVGHTGQPSTPSKKPV